jgi:hypothetical protein
MLWTGCINLKIHLHHFFNIVGQKAEVYSMLFLFQNLDRIAVAFQSSIVHRVFPSRGGIFKLLRSPEYVILEDFNLTRGRYYPR